MIQIQGLSWPDDVGTKYLHSLKHVRSLEWAIARCKQRRTAVQAGGNMGLWPRRLAEVFAKAITFEPDDISRACCFANVPPSVEVRSEALGAESGVVAIERESLGSHHVSEQGYMVPVTTVDALALDDLDFLQLDIEGYEWHALKGAEKTLARCRPLVQVELRDFTHRYGKTDQDVRDLLAGLGYCQVSAQPGNDFVFEVA